MVTDVSSLRLGVRDVVILIVGLWALWVFTYGQSQAEEQTKLDDAASWAAMTAAVEGLAIKQSDLVDKLDTYIEAQHTHQLGVEGRLSKLEARQFPPNQGGETGRTH